VQKEWKSGAMAILEEFEGIGCLSTEERRKKDNSTIVQPLLHSPCLLLYKDTTAPTLFLSIHGMDLKLFLIGQ